MIAFAIYDTMQYVKCDVQTVGFGVQASAAAFCISSGAKGKRFLLPHATVMIHKPSCRYTWSRQRYGNNLMKATVKETPQRNTC
jgi:ATP-dependent Clp endopeptidase proteolytic subunit ClpP